MSKVEQPVITAEDIYTLLVDVHKKVDDLDKRFSAVEELIAKVPEAMAAIETNPIFKPFAKMLGL
jgi:hypothetical protein